MSRRPGQRRAEPFYSKEKQCYFVKLKGKKIRLHKDKDQAWQKYYELMAANDVDASTATVAAIAELFLRDCRNKVQRGSLSESQRKLYGFYVTAFCQKFHAARASELQPLAIQDWLSDLQASVVRKKQAVRKRKTLGNVPASTGQATVSAAVKALRCCFNWAIKNKMLKTSPMSDIKASRAPQRQAIIDDGLHAQFIAATKDQEFRDVLEALRQTGCRPGELCKVTTAHVVECRGWILGPTEHKTGKKTGHSRVVMLTKEMQAMTRRLLLQRKEGEHLFLNTRKRPWTPDAITCRFTRLKEKLKLTGGECAYAYRHTGISNCVHNGVDIMTIARLFGTSAAMIVQNYAHLLSDDDELRRAQEKSLKRRRKDAG